MTACEAGDDQPVRVLYEGSLQALHGLQGCLDLNDIYSTPGGGLLYPEEVLTSGRGLVHPEEVSCTQRRSLTPRGGLMHPEDLSTPGGHFIDPEDGRLHPEGIC